MSKEKPIEAQRAAMLARVRRRIAQVERSYSDALIELMCLQAAPPERARSWSATSRI